MCPLIGYVFPLNYAVGLVSPKITLRASSTSQSLNKRQHPPAMTRIPRKSEDICLSQRLDRNMSTNSLSHMNPLGCYFSSKIMRAKSHRPMRSYTQTGKGQAADWTLNTAEVKRRHPPTWEQLRRYLEASEPNGKNSCLDPRSQTRLK